MDHIKVCHYIALTVTICHLLHCHQCEYSHKNRWWDPSTLNPQPLPLAPRGDPCGWPLAGRTATEPCWENALCLSLPVHPPSVSLTIEDFTRKKKLFYSITRQVNNPLTFPPPSYDFWTRGWMATPQRSSKVIKTRGTLYFPHTCDDDDGGAFLSSLWDTEDLKT